MLEAISKVIEHNICSDMQYNCLLGIWILLADYSTTNNLQIAVSYRSLRVQLMKSKILPRKCAFPLMLILFPHQRYSNGTQTSTEYQEGNMWDLQNILRIHFIHPSFNNYEAYSTLCFCGKLWEGITIFQRKKFTPHFRNFKEHLSFDKW